MLEGLSVCRLEVERVTKRFDFRLEPFHFLGGHFHCPVTLGPIPGDYFRLNSNEVPLDSLEFGEDGRDAERCHGESLKALSLYFSKIQKTVEESDRDPKPQKTSID